jgi:hypothetical protein
VSDHAAPLTSTVAHSSGLVDAASVKLAVKGWPTATPASVASVMVSVQLSCIPGFVGITTKLSVLAVPVALELKDRNCTRSQRLCVELTL